MDEVLADFQTPVLRIAEEIVGFKVTPHESAGHDWDLFGMFTSEQVKAIFDEIGKPGFCASLEPLPGAIEAINELRKYVDVFAVTSHFPSATWVYERDQWLQDHFKFTRRQLVHTQAKCLVHANACLDDKPENVLTWKAMHPEGLAMLWPLPNTRNLPLDEFRVKDWDDVIRRVVDMKERS